MTGGSRLSFGEYTKEKLSRVDMYNTIDKILSSTSKRSSSYKFIFFKSLLDCLDKIDSEYRLSFEIVFTRFTEISWRLILRYNFKQGPVRIGYEKNGLEKSIELYREDYNQGEVILNGALREKVSQDVKKACSKYVVGALYQDALRRLYSFSKSTETIILNPVMHSYLLKNRDIIEKLLYIKWGEYLYETNQYNPIFNIIGDLWIQKYEQYLSSNAIASLVLAMACEASKSKLIRTYSDTDEMIDKKSIVQENGLNRDVKMKFDENDLDLLDDPDKIVSILRQRRKYVN